jgi:hypothetical protein
VLPKLGVSSDSAIVQGSPLDELSAALVMLVAALLVLPSVSLVGFAVVPELDASPLLEASLLPSVSLVLDVVPTVLVPPSLSEVPPLLSSPGGVHTCVSTAQTRFGPQSASTAQG